MSTRPDLSVIPPGVDRAADESTRVRQPVALREASATITARR
jgi:hypothetical protein